MGSSQEQGHSQELEVKVIANMPSSAQRPPSFLTKTVFYMEAWWALLISIALTQSLHCQASVGFSCKDSVT